jgi:hypothetical protein
LSGACQGLHAHLSHELGPQLRVPSTKLAIIHANLVIKAASAKTAIEREFKGIFEVEWAVDPCEFL